MEQYTVIKTSCCVRRLIRPTVRVPMHINFLSGFAVAIGALSMAAWGAPGEYWEITSKVEMAGMPMAMPARTMKVCVAKGAERNPPPDKDCQMSDVRMSGNKTSWKMTCNRNGEIMTGVGESSGDINRSEGVMRFSGKSGGRSMDMTMSHQSKRIGGACDSEEMANAMKAQGDKVKEQMCDTSGFKSTADWILNSGRFIKGQSCPGKQEQLCELVRRDAPRDANAFIMLGNMDKGNGGLLAKTCGLSMDATTKAICTTLNGKNVGTLASYCPAEAKVYREAARRKACEGRAYTAKSDLSKCLSGTASMDDEEAPARLNSKAAKTAGVVDEEVDEAQFKRSDAKPKPSSNNPADAVLDGAKKLKGLFGL